MSISLNKKLNMYGTNSTLGDKPGKTGLTEQATRNMANYSGATNGSSIFKVSTKHGPTWTPGVHVNPQQNKHNFQGARQSLNSKGFNPGVGFGSGFGGYTQTIQAKQGLNGWQKASIGLGLVDQTFGILNKFLGTDATNATSQAQPKSASQALGDFANGNTVNTATTFTGQLSGVSSFNQINSMETQVAQKKAKLNNDKTELGKESDINKILTGTNVKEGLEAAGVTITDSCISSLLNASFDGQDYDQFLTDIDGDIGKIQNFQTTELGQATAKIGEQTGIVSGKITAANNELGQLELQLSNAPEAEKSAIQAKIQAKKEEIQKLETTQKQLEAAKSAVEQLKTEAQGTIDSLNEKKAEVKDIREFENKVKDKKYDLAKSQDKELGNTIDKLKKLQVEIQKASVDKNGKEYDKKDDKRATKLAQLNSQKSALLSTMSNLVSSLSAAGGQGAQIQNSKNQNYQIKNLEAALKFQPAAAKSES